jgi:hypothetical protein
MGTPTTSLNVDQEEPARMSHRSLSALAALVLSVSLAACGGGSSSSGGGSGTIPPNSPALTISPGSLAFSGPGAAAQSFTVSSSLGSIPLPAIDLLGCAPVAGISTAATTLPATYTVTPTGNGACTVVVSANHQSSSLGITVGGASSPALGAISPVTVFVGGTAGSVTVTASSGTITPDATSCSGIAQVGGSGGASPQTFTIAGIAPGTCTLVVADGASSATVAITVNANPGGASAVTITPTTLTFASPSASPQQAVLNFTGNVGQVNIDESDCTGGANGTSKPKIAFLTVPTGSLPQTVTVTPYGTPGTSGTSCSINFTSSTGATPAVMTVFIQ